MAMLFSLNLFITNSFDNRSFIFFIAPRKYKAHAKEILTNSKQIQKKVPACGF